jgi:SOS response regulatory protein OraA/RecX
MHIINKMNKSNLTTPLAYTTKYYKEHRKKESERRLQNYYKNRYGIESEDIEEFKQKQKSIRSEKHRVKLLEKKIKSENERWARALKTLRDTPSPYQQLLLNIPIENVQNQIC